MTETVLHRLANLMDEVHPTDGWRPHDRHVPGNRVARAAELFQRAVRRGLRDLVATANSLEIGLIGVERKTSR